MKAGSGCTVSEGPAGPLTSFPCPKQHRQTRSPFPLGEHWWGAPAAPGAESLHQSQKQEGLVRGLGEQEKVASEKSAGGAHREAGPRALPSALQFSHGPLKLAGRRCHPFTEGKNETRAIN